MKAPFETLSLPGTEAEAFVGAFDRPGHSALIVGAWFHSEFEEFVDRFADPQRLIQDARNFDLRNWVARQTAQNTQFESAFGGLFQATMGALGSAPDPGASDAEKYIHAARQSFAKEDEEPSFIQDLKETLEDAERLMNDPKDDSLQDVLNIMDRLQSVKADGFDDTLRVIETIGQFLWASRWLRQQVWMTSWSLHNQQTSRTPR